MSIMDGFSVNSSAYGGPVFLGDVAQSRDNNFNLIRFIAATAVLVSHAWPIALGPHATQPLKALTGHTLGGLAVFVFFAASGFFIAGSFMRSRSVRVFTAARVLRLMPGLVVSVLAVAFILGPLVTSMSLNAYLSDPQTAGFVWRNITLAFPQYTLPGVFEDLPYPAVEGSIWTLIHEVLCYGLVFVAGVTGLLMRRTAMAVAMAAYGALWVATTLDILSLHPRLAQTQELSLPFVIGVAFFLWRDRLVLSFWAMIALIAAATLAKGTVFAFPVLALALAYATFWLAYVPAGAIRRFNAVGDYSYGMYIYAFPLQGLAVWVWGPMDPLTNIALSLPITLICAVASWHWIERPALNLVPRRLPQTG